ncbi:MAG TPA: Hsp20/alpha crystallin family protein [Spirochaetales bacterium]|nr:Hsp20/alpha crystallin family protein [Spirochaetales bacterium]HPG85371.1 Hsp20/alpha crystallin family protein [Spirochaetales bacterium]HPM71617.1 Hsp20/alpha crystallin family protein [Spirochaetales bacterium]
MKGNRMYVDIGSMLDEIFDAAKNFGDQMKDNFGPGGPGCATGPGGQRSNPWFGMMDQDENSDWYPSFSYPPMNIFLTQDRSMVFEFALSGFDENDISLSFQGDYMVFSARIGLEAAPEEGVRYFKRRLKLKDIEKQKYYVPAEKFDQAMVKAVFKNGILRVTVPPKESDEINEGIKIEIVKEGE